MAKIAIVCSDSETSTLFSTFVIASGAAALGDEVIIFFGADAGLACKRGFLEEVEEEHMPSMKDLVETLEFLEVKFLLCGLALDKFGLTEDDLRESVSISGSTGFMGEISDATITFSF